VSRHFEKDHRKARECLPYRTASKANLKAPEHPQHYPHLFASDFVAVRQADIPEGYKDRSRGSASLRAPPPDPTPQGPTPEGVAEFHRRETPAHLRRAFTFFEESGGIARKLTQPPATVLVSLRDKVTASSKMWVMLREHRRTKRKRSWLTPISKKERGRPATWQPENWLSTLNPQLSTFPRPASAAAAKRRKNLWTRRWKRTTF